MIRERVKNKYLEDEITEQEYESIMSDKAAKYEKLRERFENDEINEDELEKEMDQLFESGEEFLDVDTTTSTTERVGSSIREKLSYYALPILVVAPIAAVILIPQISPMVAIFSAPALTLLGIVMYTSLYARRNL